VLDAPEIDVSATSRRQRWPGACATHAEARKRRNPASTPTCSRFATAAGSSPGGASNHMSSAKAHVARRLLIVGLATFASADTAAARADTTIAQHAGARAPGARACEGALLRVDSAFVPLTATGPVRVADVNVLWRNGENVGWLYRTREPQTYVQANGSTPEGIAFGRQLGFGAPPAERPGLGSNPYVVPKFSSSIRFDGVLPAGVRALKCFSKGGLYARLRNGRDLPEA
jgi:hypothetical protein